jgi:spore germination protein YaaH
MNLPPTRSRRSDHRGRSDDDGRWAPAVVLALLIALVVGACGAAATPPPPSASSAAGGTSAAPAAGSSGSGGAGPGGGSTGSSGGSAGASSGAPAGSAPPSGAPSAGGSPAPPVTGSYDPAKFGFAAKGLRGEVFAFVTTGQVADAVRTLDFGATSTIVFFSLQAGANGGIQNGSTLRAWDAAKTDELIAKAHASGTKVVFAMSRFSWSPTQTANSVKLLGSATARARFATEVAAEVVRRGVDGVNIDFEPIPRGQQAHFTDLVRRTRTALDAYGAGFQLTFDVVGHFDSYDVGAALAPGGADAVYLMGYHYAGTFSTIAHGTAPLGGPRYSVSDAIRGLRKVARPDQLIVGVPYYGHLWPTVSGALNARTTGRGSDVSFEHAEVIGASHGVRYDPVEAVRWSAWRGRACATCPPQWFQLYYDDATSLGTKWAEFRKQGLLGTGFWTFGFQGNSGKLAAALRHVWLRGG